MARIAYDFGILNDFDKQQEFLEREFGPDHYTDDIAVVNANSEDQATIADLKVIAPGKLKIEYYDGRQDKICDVEGCRIIIR